MTKRAEMGLYPGTFDPITNGHLDVIKRSQKLFKKIIIAVADNPNKKTFFTLDERIALVKRATAGLNVEVKGFSGLLVTFAKRNHCEIIIRALRAVSDFEYEFQYAVVNKEQNPKTETIFLMTNKEYFYLSSSVVRELAMAGGNISKLVPHLVEKEIEKKLNKK